jgi:hypothetical protein
MHPGLGPAAEAEALYVRQLKLRERLARHKGEFVIWDVGLGAAANVLAVLHATRDFPCPLRVASFDNTLEPLAFALAHKEALGYFSGYEVAVRALLEQHRVEFKDDDRAVKWGLHLADFPALIARSSRGNEALNSNQEMESSNQSEPPHVGCYKLWPPHAILFDAFSPAKNPAMWTPPLFANLFRLLDPARPCALATYSRSTMFRVTLLLAGFFVGRGQPTGLKEETTVAANMLDLLDDPLDRQWLTRAQRSGSAEPLNEPVYRQAPLSPITSEQLQRHPQFR